MVDITPKGLDDFMRNGIPWKPRPLRREIRPEEYPIESLPPLIADAVREVQAYVQAPMAMVAACALSVVSAAVQTRFDIRRDAVLTGPSSLYFLTVAEPGERKTAIDTLFMAPLREWEARQTRAAREAKAQYDAAYEAWQEDGKNLTTQIEKGMFAAAVLQHCIHRTGGLARGIGYLARLLFSRPESTQGSRYYAEPISDMPALRAFCARVTALLEQPAEFDDLDRLAPRIVDLALDARKTWITFHDEVEEQLGGDDYFSGIKDVASKAAEKAARLACCYHTFVTDEPCPISQRPMLDPCAVMRWYLDEAVRFGQVTDVTEEVRNAELLEEWLTRQMRRDRELEKSGITVNTVRQKGPNTLRFARSWMPPWNCLRTTGASG